MSTTNIAQPKEGAAKEKSNTRPPLTERLTDQVNKGLSQPPSRSQVPPATAAEEIVG